jgi:CDP-paratose synthetase
MKIILTGATGFLGTHLLSDLLHRNHQVLIAKRASTNMSSLSHRFGKLEAWNVEGDELENMFRLHPNIDVIVHAATDYGRDDSTPTSTFWANEVFPIKLLELAMKYKTALFINIDTFFNTNKAVYDHLGAYALSKRHFQEWGLHCANAGKVGFTNLRLFHLYGPGDGLEKFVPAMTRRCLAGETINLSSGEQKRDFIHVNDVVSAIAAVLKAELVRGSNYHHYDIGTGKSITIKEFMETLQRVCSSGAKLNFGALPTRKAEFQDSCANINELNMLGWRPKVGLQKGIESVIADIILYNQMVVEGLGYKPK